VSEYRQAAISVSIAAKMRTPSHSACESGTVVPAKGFRTGLRPAMYDAVALTGIRPEERES